MAVLLGLLAGVGVALVFIGLQNVVDGSPRSARAPLDRIVMPESLNAPEAKRRRRFGGKESSRRRQHSAYVPADSAGAQRGYNITLARDLARADLKITVGEFWVITVVLSSIGGLLGFALPLGGHFLLGVVLLAVGGYGPRWWVSRLKRKRQTMFNDQLADVVTLMSGSLKSGYSLLQAMELVAREAPQPISSEFDRVVREVGLGLSPEEALANLVERMQSEDLELLVTAINVQREVGGNLVEVLDTIAGTIRDRVKLIGEVKVLTAQQQYSGYIIALLPVVLALMLGVINPSYMLGVFQETTWCGWTMLGCSGSMIVAGFFAIRGIVNIKV